MRSRPRRTSCSSPHPGNYDNDLQAGVLYVIENGLANIISNSYSGTEQSDLYYGDYEDLTSWDEICEIGAFEGISVNFATGDDGDLLAAEGLIDIPVPADSPYATAVGGTSVAYSPFDGSVVQTGWGHQHYQAWIKNDGARSTPGGRLSLWRGWGRKHSLSAAQLPGVAAGIGARSARCFGDRRPVTPASKSLKTINGNLSLLGHRWHKPCNAGFFRQSGRCLTNWWVVRSGKRHRTWRHSQVTAAVTDVLPPSFPELSVAGSIKDASGTTNYSAADLDPAGDKFWLSECSLPGAYQRQSLRPQLLLPILLFPSPRLGSGNRLGHDQHVCHLYRGCSVRIVRS